MKNTNESFLSNEFGFLKSEKALETLKIYNLGGWSTICDVKRTLEGLLSEFQESYEKENFNAIKIILLNRIVDLTVTLEVLNSLHADIFTFEQVLLELKIRKDTKMLSYLDLKKNLSEKLRRN